MKKAEKLFRSKAPWIMALLMRDFPISRDDAAAIVGNWGHECGGFTLMQEQKPTVPGSKGGYGWAQWTGPRRKKFEAYCKRNNLDPASDRANYGFAFVELRGVEKKAIREVKKAKTLNAKVKAFEQAYERAGIKHYKSRNAYAAMAIDAYHKAGESIALPEWAGEAERKPVEPRPAPEAPKPEPTPPPPPAPAPEPEEPAKEPGPAKPRKLRWSKRLWIWLTTAIAGGGLPSLREAGLLELDWTFYAILAGLVVVLSVVSIVTMPEVRQKLSRAIAAVIPAVGMVLIVAAAWLAAMETASAHDWFPADCCSGFDCKVISQDQVKASAGGFVIPGNPEVVPYTSTKIRRTPPEGEGNFALCTKGGKPDGEVICLYIPDWPS